MLVFRMSNLAEKVPALSHSFIQATLEFKKKTLLSKKYFLFEEAVKITVKHSTSILKDSGMGLDPHFHVRTSFVLVQLLSHVGWYSHYASRLRYN